MKKTLSLIGASALLASCGVSISQPGPVPGAITNSSLAVASNFTLADNFTYNGVTYFAGTPVICTNLDTVLGFAFDYTGELDAYTAELIDVTTTSNIIIASETFTETQNDGEVVQAGFYNTGTANPLSKTFTPQAIVVVPANPEVSAVVRLRVLARTDGTITDTAVSRQFLVIDNCPTPQP